LGKLGDTLAARKDLWAVPFVQPVCSVISFHEQPARRSATIRAESTVTLGRPRRLPRALAAAKSERTLDRTISNLTRALADGYSQAITAELGQLEAQLATIRLKVEASAPGELAHEMRDIRKFVESRLSDLQSLLRAEALTVRAEIAKHVRNITLTPEGGTYIASGTWSVLAWQHGWCQGPELLVGGHHPIHC